jgi:hypothetical protein
MIVLKLVTHFQYDDHHIILDVIAHVENDIFMFQITLQNTWAILP